MSHYNSHSTAEVAALSIVKHDVLPNYGMMTPTTSTATTAINTSITTTMTAAINAPITTTMVKQQPVHGAENRFISEECKLNNNSAELQDFLDKMMDICASHAFIINKDYTRIIPNNPKNQETINAMERFFALRSEMECLEPSLFLLCDELKTALDTLPPDSQSFAEKKDKALEVMAAAKKLSELTSSMLINLKEMKKEVDPKIKEYNGLAITAILINVCNMVVNALVTVAFIVVSPAILLYFSIVSGVSTSAINTYRVFKNRSQSREVDEWNELEKHCSTMCKHLSEMEVGIMIELQARILDVVEVQQKNISGELTEVKRKICLIENTSDANASVHEAQAKRIKQLEEQNARQHAETKRQMEQMEMYNQLNNQKLEFLTCQMALMAANGGMSHRPNSAMPHFAVPKEYQSGSSSSLPEPSIQ